MRRAGPFLVGFGIVLPIVSAAGGVVIGWWLGLSLGGTTLLAVLYANASYIAAPGRCGSRFQRPIRRCRWAHRWA